MGRIRETIERNYRHYSAIAIIFAFIIDSITLVRVDFYLTNFLLFVYLAVVVLGIVFINLYEDGKARFMSEGVYRWIFIAMQFSFGGLFGRFLIYYSRSGSIYTSWPFLLILAGLLIGNEFAKKHYTRLILQINFLFLSVFAYLIFFIPVLLGSMSDKIFLLSGGVSLLLITLFIRYLIHLVPGRVNDRRHILRGTIGFIFISMNVLYFTNIIPPIPLSVREAQVYHSVTRTALGYVVAREQSPSFSFLRRYGTIHLMPGEPVYVFSAVFAPTNFDISVIHEWQFYNTDKESWETRDMILLPVIGGQDSGYRGYSMKTKVDPGLWRVLIETIRSQVIGQIEFRVERVTTSPLLISETL